MGKINLIEQLRKRGSSHTSSGKSGIFSFSSKESKSSDDVEFEDSPESSLDAHDKRRVLMLLVGIACVLGGRQLVPIYTAELERSVRNQNAELDSKLLEEQQTAEKFKLVQEEMRQYELRVTDLQQKLQKIRDLDENRNLLVRMTDYIVKEMPQRLWFESLSIDTKTKVSISGFSTNFQVVSDYMRKLEGAVYFPNWRLIQTEASQTSSAPVAQAESANSIEVPLDSKRFRLEADTVGL
jgi:Tfp pilus assembly protein PilN